MKKIILLISFLIFFPIISSYGAISNDYSIHSYNLGVAGQEPTNTNYEVNSLLAYQQGIIKTNNPIYEINFDWHYVSPEEEPSGTPIIEGDGGSGTGRDITEYECVNDSQCETGSYCANRQCYAAECLTDKDCDESYSCFKYSCVKLFDIKILDFDSPIKLGEFFDFKYLVKGMADIKGDVIVEFWISDNKEIITYGKDTIYLGSFEEKIETTKLFLPKNISSGVYTLAVKVSFEDYSAESVRAIELEVKGDIVEIKPKSETQTITITVLSTLIFLVLIVILILIIKKFPRKPSKKIIRKKPEIQIKKPSQTLKFFKKIINTLKIILTKIFSTIYSLIKIIFITIPYTLVITIPYIILIKLPSWIFQKIKTFIIWIWKSIKNISKNIINIFKIIFTKIGQGFRWIFFGIIKILKTIFIDIPYFVFIKIPSKIFQKIKEFIRWIIKWVKKIFNRTTDTSTKYTKKISLSIIDILKIIFIKIGKGFAQIFFGIVKILKIIFITIPSKIFQKIKELLIIIGTNIQKIFKKIIEILKIIFIKIPSIIYSKIKRKKKISTPKELYSKKDTKLRTIEIKSPIKKRKKKRITKKKKISFPSKELETLKKQYHKENIKILKKKLNAKNN
jgi:hypothetical protein